MWPGVSRGLSLFAALIVVVACEGGRADETDPSGECSNGAPCLIDDDCPGGMRCSEETCTELFCVADGVPCSTSEVCSSRECVLSPGGRVCWSGARGAGWSCSNDLDCTGSLVCDSSECATAVAALAVTPRALEFSMVEGEDNPPDQSLTITNRGTAFLAYEIRTDAPWLTAGLAGGALPPDSEGTVGLWVDGTGLAAGTLMTGVTVEAEGAAGSPAEVTITLSIVPPPPPPSCTGTPTPCTGRTSSSCTDGCEMVPGCLGATAIDCSLYSADACNFCNSIVGCACDGSSVCVEAPDEGPAVCASQTNQTTCSQFSCGWGTRCGGTPTPCEELDDATCELTPGCSFG